MTRYPLGSLYKSLFAVFGGTPLRTLPLAAPIKARVNCRLVACGFVWRYRAPIPATSGADIDVPVKTAVAVSLVYHADGILTPGATRSTQGPPFENAAHASDRSDAATVNASGTPAGEISHAFFALLPAATTNRTPSAIAPFTAASAALLRDPPRLMFAMPVPPACDRRRPNQYLRSRCPRFRSPYRSETRTALS